MPISARLKSPAAAMGSFPLVVSSAGHPNTITLAGIDPRFFARATAAPTQEVPMILCPHAWPTSASASYSARKEIAGPFPPAFS